MSFTDKTPLPSLLATGSGITNTPFYVMFAIIGDEFTERVGFGEAAMRIRWETTPFEESSPSAMLADRAIMGGETEPVSAPRLRAVVEPALAPRDEIIFLLETASEIEHALLVQYLYAAYSLAPEKATASKRAAVEGWRAAILDIAREEMGHLITVQALLRLLGAAPNLDREDYPFRSDLYPFHLRLEPLSKHALAKYVVAEMPSGVNIPDLDEILERAGANAGGSHLNRVGAVYARIMELVPGLSKAELSEEGLALAPRQDEWQRGFASLIVETPATVEEALDVLARIAEQGEGEGGDTPDPKVHFWRFLEIYRAFPETNPPTAAIPVDPVTSGDPANPSLIANPRSQIWARLCNLRYRKLLLCLAHSLQENLQERGGANEIRAALVDWTFFEMFAVGRLARLLTTLPRAAEDRPDRAAAPFESPYTVQISDIPEGRWRLHLDLINQSDALLAELNGSLPAEQQALLDGLRQHDSEARAIAKARIDQPPTGLAEIRLLPALVIGRFGSSPTPLENYDLVVNDVSSFREIVPAPTLEIDDLTGAVLGETVPAAVEFRDSASRIKPLAPFVELWARFEGEPDLKPLTLDAMNALGIAPSEIEWRVTAANFKAARRTGKAADRVLADTGAFRDHAPHELLGAAANFKPGKQIKLATVRYIKPTAEFPEVRFRITPGAGRVFGPKAGDPNIIDDVYDSVRGGWDDHWDGDPSAPLVTFPAGTYEGVLDTQQDRYVSKGYLDDSCDGVIEVSLDWQGSRLETAARFCVGVPDFAPDHIQVRTCADDLEQALFGFAIQNAPTHEEIADILRRATETVQLMNTAVANADQGIGGVATNSTNQAQHESTEYGRAFEPVFGQGGAPYFAVLARHKTLQQAWSQGVLPLSADILRSYDEAADLSDSARRKMPALMRGSDTLELTLSRRQIEMLRRAAADHPGNSTPEEAMVQLIAFFSPMATLHSHIPTDSGGFVSQLFGTPPALLSYLRSAVAKGPLGGAEVGRPLVVPGDPAASALMRLVSDTNHPMHGPFSRVVPGTNKTGVQILSEWIVSLGS